MAINLKFKFVELSREVQLLKLLNELKINDISVSPMSVMVQKKHKNVPQGEALVMWTLMVILLRVSLQLSLESCGLYYGAGTSFRDYKMLMKRIGEW